MLTTTVRLAAGLRKELHICVLDTADEVLTSPIGPTKKWSQTPVAHL